MQDRKLQSRKRIIKNCLCIIEALLEAHVYALDRCGDSVIYVNHILTKRADFIALNKNGVNHQPQGFNPNQMLCIRDYLMRNVGNGFNKMSWLHLVRHFLIQELRDIKRLEKSVENAK